MQPEINQVTQNSATHQPSCNSPASLAQHGNLSLDLSKPSLSSHGDGRAAESAGGSPGDSGAAVAVRIGAATSSERRVKPVEQAVSSVSSFNRVTEYENASTALPTHAADFGFKVVPSRTKGFARMSLEDFPNGARI